MNNFQHTKPPLFFDDSDVTAGLFEFASDAHGSLSPRPWGEEDNVYPRQSLGTALNCLLNDRYMKKYRQKGVINYKVEEGEVNTITITAPQKGIEQKLYFYDY